MCCVANRLVGIAGVINITQADLRWRVGVAQQRVSRIAAGIGMVLRVIIIGQAGERAVIGNATAATACNINGRINAEVNLQRRAPVKVNGNHLVLACKTVTSMLAGK